MVKARKNARTSPGRTLSVADLKSEIRRRGIRGTGARVAVLAYLSEASAPQSHAEIYEALVNHGYDRVTIYRNLKDLAEAGLLVRYDLGDHVWRFERKNQGAGHRAGHPHFVCVDCGGVSCLPMGALEVRPASGAPKALRTKQVEVHVKGRCDDCA
jgi:Fur family ferric uptake transcriptional regulator